MKTEDVVIDGRAIVGGNWVARRLGIQPSSIYSIRHRIPGKVNTAGTPAAGRNAWFKDEVERWIERGALSSDVGKLQEAVDRVRTLIRTGAPVVTVDTQDLRAVFRLARWNF